MHFDSNQWVCRVLQICFNRGDLLVLTNPPIKFKEAWRQTFPISLLRQDVCILSPLLSSSYDKLNCCFSQGMNSIFMYVAHLVFQHYFPVSFYVDETSHWATLAMHLWGPGFWCLVTYKMFSSDMFISI